MKFDSQCKAIIESMNGYELFAYVMFLLDEIERHQNAKTTNLEECRTIRRCIADTGISVYYVTSIKLRQTAIYRHRQDIKSTKECILKAEDRMDMMELLR